jgi:hypothetical protein
MSSRLPLDFYPPLGLFQVRLLDFDEGILHQLTLYLTSDIYRVEKRR